MVARIMGGAFLEEEEEEGGACCCCCACAGHSEEYKIGNVDGHAFAAYK